MTKGTKKQLKVTPPSAEQVASSALSDRAMLVGLTVKMWTARKLDKRVTREILAQHNATSEAGRFNKQLLSKSALEKLGKIEGKAMTLHYKMTLPWSDQGPRLIGSLAIQTYISDFNALGREFQAALDEFIAGYPLFVAQAQQELNGMFNANDYPSLDQVIRKFEFAYELDNVPNAADLRISIGNDELDQIKADIESRAVKRLKLADQEVFSRICSMTAKMVEKLRGYKPSVDGNKAESIFRDSLVDNIRELVALLPALNISGNAEIDALREMLEADLCQHDAEDLRESDSIRQKIADKAEAILNKSRGFLA
jgi:hypothetical protein